MGGGVMTFFLCHVDPNCIRNFIEIPSNSLFISSRMTRGKILNIKLLINPIAITTDSNNNNNNFKSNNNNIFYNI